LSDPDPQTVSYSLPDELREIKTSIKDLGRDVTARFDRIEGQLATKADLAALTAVDSRVKVLEVEKATRDKAREVNAEHRSNSAESRRTNWALAVGGIAALAAITEAIVQAIGH
jgi:hypothetical protein